MIDAVIVPTARTPIGRLVLRPHGCFVDQVRQEIAFACPQQRLWRDI
jgi:hypothetical protein